MGKNRLNWERNRALQRANQSVHAPANASHRQLEDEADAILGESMRRPPRLADAYREQVAAPAPRVVEKLSVREPSASAAPQAPQATMTDVVTLPKQVTHDGRPWKLYQAQYGGGPFMSFVFHFYALDEQHARKMLADLKATAALVGEVR